MNLRPYWQYYKAIFPFVATFGLIAFGVFGVYWGYAFFCTLALAGGFVGFQSFRKNEYYSYYNLGITKWQLFKISFVINLIVGIPIFLLFLSLFLVIFGTTAIT